jgi:hypothetical protein
MNEDYQTNNMAEDPAWEIDTRSAGEVLNAQNSLVHHNNSSPDHILCQINLLKPRGNFT